MKSERIFQALSEADETLLTRCEADMNGAVKSRRGPLLRWGAVAACLCLVAVGTFCLIRLGDGNRWPVKEVPDTGQASNSEIAVIPHWEELTPSQQYSRLSLAGTEYDSIGSDAQLSGAKLVPLSRAELSGTDPYTDEVHRAQADVFSLQGVSSGCVVAVRFDGSDELSVYANSAYQPQTLGQFVDDLGLRSHIRFGSVWYHYQKRNGSTALVEFTDLDAAVVWEMLLADMSAAAVEDFDAHEFHSVMSISVDIPLFGYKNISLSVTQDGYLVTNILQTGKAFYIGQDKVQAFVDHVTAHCTGYEIVYTGDTASQPEQSGQSQSSSAVSHSIS